MGTGTLYLVGTPVGNLEDLTYRAVRILGEVDVVAAEDTRVSGKLLHYLNLSKPMVSYHEHNRRQRGPELVQRMLRGETCALVTDAGMPAVSDPGEELADLCHEAGIPVVPVPEACAHYETHEPRGEFVLVIEGAREDAAQSAADRMAQAIALTEELTAAGLTLTAAVKQAARQTGARKNQLYQAMLARESGETGE